MKTISVTIENEDVCQSDNSAPLVSLASPIDGAILEVGNVALEADVAQGLEALQAFDGVLALVPVGQK